MRGRALLVLFLGLACFQERAFAGPPTERVRSMLEEAMAIQNDPRLQGAEFREERRAAIRKVIGRNFDFDLMAAHVLGPYGPKLKPGERTEFKGLFRDLFQDSYTKLVLDFLKQEQVVYHQEEMRSRQALVKTTLVRPNEEIPVDYSLALVGGQWSVDDVTVDGVSIVRNYRQSFTRVIQRESFPALLKKMRLQRQAIAPPS